MPAFDLDAFGRRHIGTTPRDHEWMLAALGYDSLEALLTAVFGPPVLWLLARIEGRLDPARLRVGLSRRRPRALTPGIPPR